jgi:signal transduction histidine kinase
MAIATRRFLSRIGRGAQRRDGGDGVLGDLFALEDLGRRLTLTESVRLLERTIVERSVDLLRADCGGLLLAGDGRVRLVCQDGCLEEPTETGLRLARATPGDIDVVELSGTLCPRCVLPDDAPLYTAAAPLISHRKWLGVLFLTYRRPRPLSQRRRYLLTAVANEAAAALRNLELYLWSEERAILEERARIAREIHDGLQQSLAAKLMKISLIERLLTIDPSKVPAELAALKRSLQQDIQEIRHSVLALTPIDLESQGLERAVESYAREFADQTGIQVRLHLDVGGELGPKHQTAVYRLFQEALNNVRKHAQATQVEIDLLRGERELRLVIRDNGVGFDVAAARRRSPSTLGGLGLVGMQERVRSVGGDLQIVSQPGAGTLIEVHIPLRREGDRADL